MVLHCIFDIECHSFLELPDLLLQILNQVFYFRFTVQFIMRFSHFNVEDLQLVLALLYVSLGLRQILIHVKEHVGYDCSHLVFYFKSFLLVL